MYTPNNSPTFAERNRIIIKGLLVGVLILLMLVPGQFVASLVSERQERQTSVVDEVSNKWAGKQTVTGPVLMVPYHSIEVQTDGRMADKVKMAYVLPDVLKINGSIQSTEKKRSLYSVMLYSSTLNLSGKFGALPLDALQIAPESVIWKDVRLALNVGDMRGIDDQVKVAWNGGRQLFEAGVPGNALLKEGLSAPVTLNASDSSVFSIDLSLKGSDGLYFAPTGKTTEATLHANWKDPAFDGMYLPATSSISGHNFDAHWKVLPLSHSNPQYWKDGAQELGQSAFGVRLIQPVDGYAKTNRCVKYAILFIALTFTFFFFIEILQKRAVHPLQYIIIGLALTIFYTLLLSISEYTGFNIAYLIASSATVSLVGMYAWSIVKSGRTAAGMTASLCALYGYIFVLIQLEDYALLFGSIGLFVIMAIIMFYSRKIDWYSVIGHQPVPTHYNGEQYMPGEAAGDEQL